MKPNLKPPGSKLLKLTCDGPLSNFAFKFKLRRYTMGIQQLRIKKHRWHRKAGAYTRPFLS